MQCFKLEEHYTTHHPGAVASEWTFDEGAKRKQPKLTSYLDRQHGSSVDRDNASDHSQQEDNDLQTGQQQSSETEEVAEVVVDDVVAEDIDVIEDCADTETENVTESKIGDKLPDTSGSFLVKLLAALNPIAAGVKAIEACTRELTRLIKLLLEKHSIKANPLAKDYGSYASIQDHVIVFEKERLKIDLRRCVDVDHSFSTFPFLGFDDEEGEMIKCEFCPTVLIRSYTSRDRSSQRFGNTKSMILTHLLSHGHMNKVKEDFNKKEEEKQTLMKDEKAGKVVFETVYGGMKQGYSFSNINCELCLLARNGVEVGNINHSEGTLDKIKTVIARVLRSKVRGKLSQPLTCTKQLGPVSELFDKMTHLHRTGQMQLIIAQLMNEKELLMPIYLDNHLTTHTENTLEDMIDLVRTTAESYYLSSQVENGASDGAYAKNENLQEYYVSRLELTANGWVSLMWDYAHLTDLAEGNACEAVPAIEQSLDLAQCITKVFRFGKEYSAVYGNEPERCLSLTDAVVEVSGDLPDDNEEEEESLTVNAPIIIIIIHLTCQFHLKWVARKPRQPVIRSNLKFAARAKRFCNNYNENLPVFRNRIIDVLMGDVNAKRRAKLEGLLSKVTVKHATVMLALQDVYSCLSKAQHGVTRVNQLPWQFHERIQHLIDELQKIKDKQFHGCISSQLENLMKAEFKNGSTIVTLV